jgi:outer membrane lipoprotein-sorting protein
MDRRGLVVLAVAALAATSACASLPGSGGTDRPPSEDVAAAFEAVDALNGTTVVRVADGNGTGTTRRRVTRTFGDPSQLFAEVLAPAADAGSVTAVNETRQVQYRAAANEASVVDRDVLATTDPQNPGEYYAAVVAAARENTTVRPPQGGVSPLPVVPVTPPPEAAGSSERVTGYAVEYLGTETVAGRTTHGFRLTPASDAAVNVTRTLWLDDEYYYPLRETYRVNRGGESYRTEHRFERVSFNPDVPESTFDWRPPADASVNMVDADVTRYATVGELRNATDLPVPSAELSGGLSFQSGEVFERDRSQVTVTYASDGGERVVVSVVPTPGEPPPLPRDGENVTVDGRDAVYATNSASSVVTWQCDSVRYVVRSASVDRERLLAVAASVACEYSRALVQRVRDADEARELEEPHRQRERRLEAGVDDAVPEERGPDERGGVRHRSQEDEADGEVAHRGGLMPAEPPVGLVADEEGDGCRDERDGDDGDVPVHSPSHMRVNRSATSSPDVSTSVVNSPSDSSSVNCSRVAR